MNSCVIKPCYSTSYLSVTKYGIHKQYNLINGFTHICIQQYECFFRRDQPSNQQHVQCLPVNATKNFTARKYRVYSWGPGCGVLVGGLCPISLLKWGSTDLSFINIFPLSFVTRPKLLCRFNDHPGGYRGEGRRMHHLPMPHGGLVETGPVSAQGSASTDTRRHSKPLARPGGATVRCGVATQTVSQAWARLAGPRAGGDLRLLWAGIGQKDAGNAAVVLFPSRTFNISTRWCCSHRHIVLGIWVSTQSAPIVWEKPSTNFINSHLPRPWPWGVTHIVIRKLFKCTKQQEWARKRNYGSLFFPHTSSVEEWSFVPKMWIHFQRKFCEITVGNIISISTTVD